MSDLFLDLTGKKPRVLDFEYDGSELHERCGGKTYYTSRSGLSGAGYLENLGTLMPLGRYRVDTVTNEHQSFVSIGKACYNYDMRDDVLVAVPYASHEADKAEILRTHPVVVRLGRKVVYCDFFGNFTEILRIIFSGEELPEECEMDGARFLGRGYRDLSRRFSELDPWGDARAVDINIEFYNLCSMNDVLSPWEFFRDELQRFTVEWSRERLFHLLAVDRLQDGTFVRTRKLAGGNYHGEILPGNPLETGELTAGWQRLADDVLARFYDGSNEVHLVAYASAKAAHEELAQRFAYRMGEGEEFVSFASKCGGEYEEYEIVVPKVIYALDPAAQLAELRRKLAKKIRRGVADRVRQWIEDMNDQKILETIPDDLVVTFDDSLEAGNCRPGSQEFVARYFPGQTETTAKELKAYADSYNVMRIFRHLAVIGRFNCDLRTFSA